MLVSAFKSKNLSGNLSLARRTKLIFLAIIFISTLFFRLNEYYTYRDFNTDKARQLHGAFNLMQGKGVSFESYDLNTFEPLYRPIIDWPPAYSFIIAGVSFLSGKDLYTSSVIFDFIAYFFLWIVLLWLTRLIKLGVLPSLLLFFFLAISKTPLQFVFSADLLGTVLFLSACGINISYAQQKINPLWFYIFQLLLILTMVFLKYSLFPVVCTLGISLITFAFFSKQKKFYTPGFILLFFTTISIAAVFLYNRSISGDMVWMDKNNNVTDNVFNFENLLLFSPFLGITFFYPGSLYSIFGYQLVQNILLVLTFALLTWMIIKTSKNIFNKGRDYFDHLLLTAVILVIGYLCMLSVYYPVDAEDVFKWTFVTEYRYYAPAIFLFLLYLFKQVKKANRRKSISNFPLAFIVGFIVYAGFLKIYHLLINNRAGSFENFHSKVFDVSNYLKDKTDPNTFFVSFTKNDVTDAQVTSLVAMQGGKVAMSYYGYFKDSSFNSIYNSKPILQGKKLIIYFDQNRSILDSINKKNNFWIEKTKSGQELLIINN